jgi:hypothetical protein
MTFVMAIVRTRGGAAQLAIVPSDVAATCGAAIASCARSCNSGRNPIARALSDRRARSYAVGVVSRIT